MNPGKSWGYMNSSGAEPDRAFPITQYQGPLFYNSDGKGWWWSLLCMTGTPPDFYLSPWWCQVSKVQESSGGGSCGYSGRSCSGWSNIAGSCKCILSWHWSLRRRSHKLLEVKGSYKSWRQEQNWHLCCLLSQIYWDVSYTIEFYSVKFSSFPWVFKCVYSCITTTTINT